MILQHRSASTTRDNWTYLLHRTRTRFDVLNGLRPRLELQRATHTPEVLKIYLQMFLVILYRTQRVHLSVRLVCSHAYQQQHVNAIWRSTLRLVYLPDVFAGVDLCDSLNTLSSSSTLPSDSLWVSRNHRFVPQNG